VRAVPCTLLGQVARRPVFAALSSERGLLLPGLEHALERYMGEAALLAETTHANLDPPTMALA